MTLADVTVSGGSGARRAVRQWCADPCRAARATQGDGANRLVVVDSDMKMRVFKGAHTWWGRGWGRGWGVCANGTIGASSGCAGTSRCEEFALLESPVGIVAFFPGACVYAGEWEPDNSNRRADDKRPRIPSIAVAAGSHMFVYRNMRPYYKFSLPSVRLRGALRTDACRALSSTRLVCLFVFLWVAICCRRARSFTALTTSPPPPRHRLVPQLPLASLEKDVWAELHNGECTLDAGVERLSQLRCAQPVCESVAQRAPEGPLSYFVFAFVFPTVVLSGAAGTTVSASPRGRANLSPRTTRAAAWPL